MENPFNHDIEQMKKMRDKVNAAASESEDVKAGRCTAEDERQEPGYVLYNHIVDSVISTLKKPEIVKAFAALVPIIGEDKTKELINVITISCAMSSYESIVFYDELLKKEISNKFEFQGDHINLCKSDIAAIKGVLEVFRKRLDKLEKPAKVAEAAAAAGINIDPNDVN